MHSPVPDYSREELYAEADAFVRECYGDLGLEDEIDDRLDLDTRTDRSLWKDEALLVLSRAVLHSFDADGVQLVDHHTVTDQFEQFEHNEAAAGREVTGDRAWLLPPMSSATTHVFESTYDNSIQTPNFFYQEAPGR